MKERDAPNSLFDFSLPLSQVSQQWRLVTWVALIAFCTGFRGQEFDFQGQPGSIYAFLSCPGLELNVLLEDAYTSGFSVQKDALGSAWVDGMVTEHLKTEK